MDIYSYLDEHHGNIDQAIAAIINDHVPRPTNASPRARGVTNASPGARGGTNTSPPRPQGNYQAWGPLHANGNPEDYA